VDLIRPYHTQLMQRRHHSHSAAESARGSTRRIVVRPNHANGHDRELSPSAQDYRDYLTAMRQMNMDLEELMVSFKLSQMSLRFNRLTTWSLGNGSCSIILDGTTSRPNAV
jgi:hypothetical protein